MELLFTITRQFPFDKLPEAHDEKAERLCYETTVTLDAPNKRPHRNSFVGTLNPVIFCLNLKTALDKLLLWQRTNNWTSKNWQSECSAQFSTQKRASNELEPMSIFSPALAARFDALVEKYPLKRSALIPMLLYSQDEIGYLSDAVIEEIAARLDLTTLDVRNVASYYSMLRFKPVGKYNVQVCTNISCMLRGAYDLFEHLEEKLGIWSQGRYRRRPLFDSKKWNAHRRLLLGSGYVRSTTNFHDDLTNDKVDAVLASYRAKEDGAHA